MSNSDQTTAVNADPTTPMKGVTSNATVMLPNETDEKKSTFGRPQDGLLSQTFGGFASSSSSAATMLMAANTLAQTPAQSVSNSLLGQVQLVATEQQIRRSSLPDSATLPSQPGWDGATMSQQAGPSTEGLRGALGNGWKSNTALPSALSNFSSTLSAIPQSPGSAATLQVGSIATQTAAHEYLEQVSFLLRGRAPTASTIDDKPFPSSRAQKSVWSDSDPLKGVPSLPRKWSISC
jgi:hypothetical protein